MNIILSTLCLIAPIAITGIVALLLKTKKIKLDFILAFSAAYLFTLSITHLLPEAFQFGNTKQVGLFIVLGFCLQLAIDTFSTGIEHGHVHLHSHECNKQLPLGIIIGLLLHSFLEGLPIYNGNIKGDAAINYQLIFGLALHNIPITIAFVALLKEHKSTEFKKWLLLFLFSVMTPIGYLTSFGLQTIGVNNFEQFNQIAFALVIGIFLHLSTAILFETREHHKYNKTKIVMMISGIVLAYLVS